MCKKIRTILEKFETEFVKKNKNIVPWPKLCPFFASFNAFANGNQL